MWWASGFPNWMLALAMVLWAIACIAGTFGSSLMFLPRDAHFTLDGESIDFCSSINPDVVEADLSVAWYWCSADEVLGRSLPAGAETIQGRIRWSDVSWEDIANMFGQPQLWLTLGLGLTSLIFLTGFAKATGTLRAGLAAAISVVFLGLLLFPTQFTGRLPADMRTQLVEAWKWVIAFYFGSEAAVQAIKVYSSRSSTVGGDTAPTTTTTTTTVPAAE
jgi:hypothetical protein